MLKLGYPWLSLRSAQRYPYLSLLIPSNTDLNHRGISLDIPLQESYPCISQNNFSIPTYKVIMIQGCPWIGHRSGYPGISWYKSGFGRVSFFQMSKMPLASQGSNERLCFIMFFSCFWLKKRLSLSLVP